MALHKIRLNEISRLSRARAIFLVFPVLLRFPAFYIHCQTYRRGIAEDHILAKRYTEMDVPENRCATSSPRKLTAEDDAVFCSMRFRRSRAGERQSTVCLKAGTRTYMRPAPRKLRPGDRQSHGAQRSLPEVTGKAVSARTDGFAFLPHLNELDDRSSIELLYVFS